MMRITPFRAKPISVYDWVDNRRFSTPRKILGCALAIGIFVMSALLLMLVVALILVLVGVIASADALNSVLRIEAGVVLYPFLLFYVLTAMDVVAQIVRAMAAGMHLRYAIVLPVVYSRNIDGTHLRFRWIELPGSAYTPSVGVTGDYGTLATTFTRRRREAAVVAAVVTTLIGAIALVSVGLLAWRFAESRFWLTYWLSLPGLVFVLSVADLWAHGVTRFRQPASKSGIRPDLDPSVMRTRQLQRMVALEYMQWTLLDGYRPAAWDTTSVMWVIGLPDGSPDDAISNWYAHEYALDRGGIQAARWYLTRALAGVESLDPIWQSIVYRSAAYFAARHQLDPVAARNWFHKVTTPTLDRHTDLRAEAAILLVEGKPELARQIALRGIKHLRPSLMPGYARVDEDRLREIIGATNR